MQITAGTLIDQKYEIRGTIGSGGMGVVYEAYQLGLERIVAIKMLTASTSLDDECYLRFKQEALILNSLTHPNIVQFYAFGIWDTVPYIVIEHVNGHSLQQLISRNEPLEVIQALDIASQACDGLQHIHSNDVLHRDLKPTNILITEYGQVRTQAKLIDFGLAKSLASYRFQQLTQEGLTVGSVMYASPEQCLGQPLDSRSDIYGLGCVLYQMLTGYPPFTGDNATAVMFQQLNESVINTRHWSKIGPDLQLVIEKCMAKQKEQRYSSALALNNDLRKMINANQGNAPIRAKGFRSQSSRFAQKITGKLNAYDSKQFILMTLLLSVLCMVIAGTVMSLRVIAVSSSKQLMPCSARDQLFQLVYSTEVQQIDDHTADRLISLIDLYKSDRSYSTDHTDLVLKAYTRAVKHRLARKQFALARQYCKQALEDCSRITGNSYEYLGIVLSYYEACLSVHCELSLMPLLEESLRRFPDADAGTRCNLYLALGDCYLKLERFEAARSAATQASALIYDQNQKNRCRSILNICNRKQKRNSSSGT